MGTDEESTAKVSKPSSSSSTQESATNKKGSFDQMLVDGANARKNSVSTIPHSSVPGNPAVSMSPTSLNIGMDLWDLLVPKLQK
ncbi:hypothetical protein JHK82_028829 [Glycine max]|uniref:Uncharacterized protein n=2 Tax=Glycine subgen. Soja TaxID=1462606 RepID=K7LKQ3_SOYBN|nr:hypothetical protein JHK87_028745 [Glycine soja]KAG4998057.1 hypothetical protein JHK85_029496 [Glycine max]KAG5127994.1 hypothetical protein JHK82_028829 [Glycine max]KAG5152607.1 hypothetical protein JHK84_029079 [Glycine max]KAH1139423.1 hypothetical protein GYH30_028703 [Glycine max]